MSSTSAGIILLLLASCSPERKPDPDTGPIGHDSADGAETGDTAPDDTDTDDTDVETDTDPHADDTADTTDTTPADDTGPRDTDGDGTIGDADCDDTDPEIHPGAPERCNGVDDDCDDEIDEGTGTAWYPDADGDGEGDAAGAAVVACGAPAGTVANDTDCDDGDAAISSSAREICGNAVDDDCDGDIDETCIPSGALDTDLAQTTYQSGLSGDLFGNAIAPTADWTGDGVPDIAMGALMDDSVDTGAGAVYLFDGADKGALTMSDVVAFGYGGGYDFSYGQALSPAADLDGDGDGELLIGSPGWSWYPGVYAGAGAVTIVTGLVGANLDETVEWTSYVEYADLGLGAATADLDGDGASELLAGAYTYGYATGTSTTGMVYVIDSGDVLTGGDVDSYGTALVGPAGSAAGYGITNVGDLDGDGDDEVIVGSGGLATDVAWVLDGLPSGGNLDDWARTTFTGTASNYDGFATSAPGDFDGDGLADLVVTAPWDDTSAHDAGAVFVFGGDATGTVALTDARLVLTGESAGAFAGSAISTAGDLDEDGKDDLLVGAKWESAYDGRIYVVTGSPTGTVDLGTAATIFSPTSMQQLGFEVDGTTDFDGIPELFFGSHPLRYGVSEVFRWDPVGG